jgi:hypothetical protein
MKHISIIMPRINAHIAGAQRFKQKPKYSIIRITAVAMEGSTKWRLGEVRMVCRTFCV